MKKIMPAGKRGGFTLIEIVVVIAIIAVLSGAVLIGVGSFRSKARDSRRLADLKQVQNGLELFYSKNGYYPAALADLQTDPQLNITNIPKDPADQSDYSYARCGTAPSNYHNYVLGATLEADFGDKIFASSNTTALTTGNCSGVTLVPVNTCSHTDPNKYYCLSL